MKKMLTEGEMDLFWEEGHLGAWKKVWFKKPTVASH